MTSSIARPLRSQPSRGAVLEPLEARRLCHAEPAAVAAGTGLRGEYFDRADLTQPKFTRTDPTVNFAWGTGSPDPRIGAETFSVRWTGQVRPAVSQAYTFYAQVNDGARLWVNGKLLVDRFGDNGGGGTAEYRGTIALTAGTPYSLKMEFVEQDGGATARLLWSSPSTPKAVVPKSALYPPAATPSPPPPVGSGGVSSLWRSAAPIPVARHEGSAVAVGGQMLVLGGYTGTSLNASVRLYAYDPADNAWSRLADMPEALTHAGVVVDGETVWVVGGFVGKNPGPSTAHVWKYDVAANEWSAGPSLPEPRAGGGLALLGRELHYFGGYGAGDLYHAPDEPDHYVLNLEANDTGGEGDTGPANVWTTAAPMASPRNHMAGVSLGGKAYAVGGQTGGGDGEIYRNQSRVDAYDPDTDTWTRVASMPVPRGHIGGSTFVLNGRIVVAGGVTNGGVQMNDVTEYDPALDAWVALPDLPASRQAGMAALVGDTVVFTGGETGKARSQPDTWLLKLAGQWEKAPALPVPLAETAGGIINGKLYVVGEGSAATFAYDLARGTWQSNLAARQYVGDHHAAEVYNGKLYLFGGFNGGASGKVQIYDPVTNKWSLGPAMPFAPGSAATARVGDAVYVAGGIVGFVPNVGGTTTTKAARFDLATSAWTPLPDLPRGVNHAAAASDGERFWIFGGRAGKGGVEDGFDTVQVYDPVAGTWATSDDPASVIAPVPRARGGTGKAVFANGEFYVIGGETKAGPGATANRVYTRVDIYNPVTNAWRAGPPLPTARHGIFPLLYAGRIYVAAGGVKAGESRSTAFEVLNLG